MIRLPPGEAWAYILCSPFCLAYPKDPQENFGPSCPHHAAPYPHHGAVLGLCKAALNSDLVRPNREEKEHKTIQSQEMLMIYVQPISK